MQNHHRGSVQIRQVNGGSDLREFIRLPYRLYRNDPAWVPPLLLEQRQRLTKHNPYFEHARWSAWLAIRDKKVVGRISAQIDELFLERHDPHTGFFGMLEATEDTEVFSGLFEVAEDWLRKQGIHRVRGPFNLSINEECGLLVEGLDTPPFIMMGHALPYYPGCIQANGYRPVQTLLAYYIRPDFQAPDIMSRLSKKAAQNVKLRPLNRSRIREDLGILRDIFNDAWVDNWGFVPFTEAEFREVGKNLAMLIDDDFVQIAELDGEPVAMVVALPNVNDAIRDLNGRLLPFGWLKLLWRLKVRYPKTARVPLMGVRKKYQNSRLGPALAFLVMEEVRQSMRRKGIESGEMSWILEGNSGMRNIIETIGGEPYKRYRIFEKELDA
mgnify:FL=1